MELEEDLGVKECCMDDFCGKETGIRFVKEAYKLMSIIRLLTFQKQPSPTLSNFNLLK